MKQTFSAFLLAFFVTANSQSEGEMDSSLNIKPKTQTEKLFTLAGSNTLGAKLTPSWSQAYLEYKGANNIKITTLNENEKRIQGFIGSKAVYIDVLAHGSSTGFKALKSQTAHTAMSSRPINKSELVALSHLGDLKHPSSEHIVAIDGLAVITHPDIPIQGLSTEEVAKIFSGEVTNWNTFSSLDQDISIFARDKQSGTWDTFKSLVLKKKRALSSTAKRFESNDELSDTVSNTPGAIGFVGLASVRKAKALAIKSGPDGILMHPTKLLVATEDYPLTRRLFLYTSENIKNPNTSEFVHFVQEQIAQDLVEKIGFISQNPIKIHTPTSVGPLIYQNLSNNADRLSINFRFNSGSSSLDNKAKRDVQRLSLFLKKKQNEGLKVQLVGFSDKRATTELSNILAKLRATAVKLELFKYDISTESIIGLGSNLPITNSTKGLNHKNNRVEVWILKK